MSIQPSATPICTACGNDQGIVRSLGRDNDEIISYCPVCCPHPSATPEPYAHEWHITVKADEHAGAIDALFNCIKAWQSGSEPIGGTCPRSMGNRQTYDVVKGGREGRTLEIELAAARAECEYRGKNADSWRKSYDERGAELARLRAENLTVHQMACAAALERDRLRAENADAKQEAATNGHLSNQANDTISSLRAEVERLKKDGAADAFADMAVRASNADSEIARLRAEVKQLTEPRSVWVSASTYEHALARAERAEAAQLDAIARRDIAEAQLALKNSQCERAEQVAAAAQRDLAAVRKDSERLDYMNTRGF